MDYKHSPVERVHLEDSTDPAYRAEVESRIVRKGVVGIVERDGKYLVIQRSEFVPAPLLYSFPGGGIEPGETPQQALIREFTEELGVPCTPRRRILESLSAWGAHIAWWLADMTDEQIAAINPSEREVAQVLWLTPDEIKYSDNNISSMYLFFDWLEEQKSL